MTTIYLAFTRGFRLQESRREDAENSLNTELGFRFDKGALHGDYRYYNNFSNLQGSDSMSGGGAGTGDLFNAGHCKGIELLATYDVSTTEKRFKLPVTLSYTFTDTKLKNNFNSSIWGTVESGDEIPYIAKNQLAITAALETTKFNFSVSGKYVDAFRTLAGTGTIPAKKSHLIIIDLSARYHISEYISLMGNVINVLDKEYAVSRVPAGLRPGHPFGINFGIMAEF
jgi:Fe(3+) dicitrate transport protein